MTISFLDACCAINLYASKQMPAILEALPVEVVVASYVREKEVLEVYDGPKDKITQRKEQINLQPFIDRGLLLVVSLDNDNENRDVVNFAYSGIDDGEAITGAIARHRNWCIGTDDNAAISFFKKEIPQIQVVTTPELIQSWAEIAHPTVEIVKSSLQNIQLRANYQPGPNHPLYNWWKSYPHKRIWKF